MGSQNTSGLFFGPCFGDSTPSESSAATGPITDLPSSGPLTLGEQLIMTTEPNGSVLSDYCAAQISVTRLDALRQVPEQRYQVNYPPNGLSTRCQDNGVDVSITYLRTSHAIENPDGEWHRHITNQPGFDVDVALPFARVNTGEMAITPVEGVPPKTFVNSASPLGSPDVSDLPTKPLLLNSDRPPSQNTPVDVLHAPNSKASDCQNNSPLSHILSFNLQPSCTVDPGDILSRSTLNGEKDDHLKTEPELIVSARDALLEPALDLPNSPIDNCNCEPDPLNDSGCLALDSSSKAQSFTPGGRSEDLDSVSDSSGQIEHSQLDPHITPATNFRGHNLTLRTEIEGTQELPSSSPPSSSPTMNLNFMPSSSPIPSSSPMPCSSPLNRMLQTPPFDAYKGTGQEGLYADEILYPAYLQYQLEHLLNDNQNQSQDGYEPTPLYYPPSMSAPTLAPPFAPNLLNQVAEHPHSMEQYAYEPTAEKYTQENTNFISFTSLQPTFPPAEQSHQHNEKVEFSTDKDEVDRNSPKGVIPAPKRSTVAGQRAQQKKLSRPFRPPAMHAPVRLAPKPPADLSAGLVSSNTVVLEEFPAPSSTKLVEQSGNAVASASSQPLDTKIKHRTTRAASQFKSPLTMTSAARADEASLVRLTPTIQSLERKLQLLRRALKVREGLQEEVLGGLAKKWSEAGREVAWEVWDNVKNNANSEEGRLDKGKRRPIEESWGWDNGGDAKKSKVERNSGWDTVCEGVGDAPESETGEETIVESQKLDEEADEQTVPYATETATVGTMLMQLGILPETLGWNEEEGMFVDE